MGFLRRRMPVEQKKRRLLILAGLLALVALNIYVKITTHSGLAVRRIHGNPYLVGFRVLFHAISSRLADSLWRGVRA